MRNMEFPFQVHYVLKFERRFAHQKLSHLNATSDQIMPRKVAYVFGLWRSFLNVMTQISLIITEEGGMVSFVPSAGNFGANSAEENEPNFLSNPGVASISSTFKLSLFLKLKVS